MRSRVQVIFWSTTLVAVILLGVTWTLAQRVAVGGASVEDDIVLAVAGAGLAAASWWPGGSWSWLAGCGGALPGMVSGKRP